MISGNDAANVLAENCGKDIHQFMAGLNEYIRNLGCHSTHFLNPHGLHHSSHTTSARDLATIAQKALKNSIFREIVSKIFYQKPKTNKNPSVLFETFNPLLKGRFYYPYAIGVKTGYHSQAKYTLVAAAKNDERELIAVLLNSPTKESRFKDAILLFEAAFNEKKFSEICFSKNHLFTKNIEGGAEILNAHILNDLSYSYFGSEKPKLKGFIEWNKISLPIQRGEKVGKILLKDDSNQVWSSQDLFAENEVKPTFFFKIKNWFSKGS